MPRARLFALSVLLVVGWFAATRPTPLKSQAQSPARLQPPAMQVQAPSAPPGLETAVPHPDNPLWAIPFGHEFWRKELATSPQRSNSISDASILAAIDRVTHVFSREEGGASVALKGGEVSISEGELRFERRADDYNSAATPKVSTRISFASDAVDDAMPKPDGTLHIVGNTAQRLLRTDLVVVEHFEARSEGVQVSWILREPPTRGDLVVEAEVHNAQFVSRDGAGHLFANAETRTKLRVGDVEAVDSMGKRWSILLQHHEGILSARVPASVLAEARYPLAVDPLISPEFELDSPTNGPASSTRFAPSIAASESGYFVAWTQGAGESGPAGVFGARVTLQGQLLDPYGIHVSPASEQSKCAVAAQRDLFLIVWSALRGVSTSEWDIFGARIQPDGTVLDRPARVICGVSGHQGSPSLAANGTNFLAAWRDARGSGIFANIIDTNGNVFLSQGFPVCSAAGEQFTPAVASLNGNYFVVWEDYRSALSTRLHPDIYGARVSGDGRVLDTNGFAICTLTNAQYAPAVAASGTNYLVVWEDYSAMGNDIEGTRVSAGGQVLDNPPIAIAQLKNTQFSPSVAAHGEGWLVAWQDYANSTSNRYHAAIRGQNVGGDGLLSTPEPQPLSTATGQLANPALAALNGSVASVWQDDRRNAATMLNDIYGYSEGITVPPAVQNFLVSSSANAELSAALACDGTNYLVVWADTRNFSTTGRDILGLRLSQDAEVVDPAPILICTNSSHQSDPAVSSGPQGFLVAWSDLRNTPTNALHADIYGALISADGVLSIPNGFPICTTTNDQVLPALTLLGTNYFVVWQDARSNTIPSGADIFGARVTPGGQVLDPLGMPICTNRANQLFPVIASLGDQALVVWTDFRNNSVAGDIFAARVTESGLIADVTGLPLCTAINAQSAPAVAAGSQGYYVAWADARNGAALGTDIYGTLVTREGTMHPTNGVALRLASGAQGAPTVAFNGLDFLIAWQEPQPGVTTFNDIYATGVNANGAPWGGLPIALNPGSENQELPMSVAGKDARFLLLNQTLRYSAPRITGSLVHLSALPRLMVPRLEDGVATIEIRGAPGERYLVEASSDLKAWMPVATFTMTNSPSSILDSSAVTNSVRFYRAVLLQ